MPWSGVQYAASGGGGCDTAGCGIHTTARLLDMKFTVTVAAPTTVPLSFILRAIEAWPVLRGFSWTAGVGVVLMSNSGAQSAAYGTAPLAMSL